jgi:hypothetical protein
VRVSRAQGARFRARRSGRLRWRLRQPGRRRCSSAPKELFERCGQACHRLRSQALRRAFYWDSAGERPAGSGCPISASLLSELMRTAGVRAHFLRIRIVRLKPRLQYPRISEP